MPTFQVPAAKAILGGQRAQAPAQSRLAVEGSWSDWGGLGVTENRFSSSATWHLMFAARGNAGICRAGVVSCRIVFHYSGGLNPRLMPRPPFLKEYHIRHVSAKPVSAQPIQHLSGARWLSTWASGLGMSPPLARALISGIVEDLWQYKFLTCSALGFSFYLWHAGCRELLSCVAHGYTSGMCRFFWVLHLLIMPSQSWNTCLKSPSHKSTTRASPFTPSPKLPWLPSRTASC